MRRLARRLFPLCSAVSLLVCVGLVALWIRSYTVADAFVLESTPRTHRQVLTAKGDLLYRWTSVPPESDIVVIPGPPVGHRTDDPSRHFVLEPRQGPFFFRYNALTVPLYGVDEFNFEIPLWAVAFSTALLPLAWFASRWRKACPRARCG